MFYFLYMTISVHQQPDKAPDMPPELLRRFEVTFRPLSKSKAIPMRRIGAEHVGKLVSVKVNSYVMLPAQAIYVVVLH